MHNQDICNYLNNYIINPNPEFAILINGKWGCGKTFFIKKWVNNYQKINNVDQVLTPIYVTLYGLKSVQQITESINRELFPYLYSKTAQVAKSLIKFGSKIAFRTDFDFNNDKQNDLSVTFGFDALSALKSNNDEIKHGTFLIFDDIERSNINIKELLGYINFFIEHCNCHVIIIGDESQFSEEDRNAYGRFKEKSIGREFTLTPNVEDAVEAFVSCTPLNGFILAHKEDIKKTFNISKTQNLRILKQCLWDLSNQLDCVKMRNTKRCTNVLKSIMCTFIATYCEYKGDNKKIIDDWRNRSDKSLLTKNEETKTINQKFANIGDKYSAYPSFNIFPIFKPDFVDYIVNYIQTGQLFTEYIDDLTKPTPKRPSWEKMSEAIRMSNSEFEHFLYELIEDICCVRIPSVEVLGQTIVYLAFYNHRIIKLSKESKSQLKNVLPHYLDKVQSQDEVYRLKTSFCRGTNMLPINTELEILEDLCTPFFETCEKKISEFGTSMTILLENLSDSNCKKLFDLDNKALPDRSTTYGSISLFDKINIKKLFECLCKLSNESRQNFNSYIRHHYMLNYSIQGWERDYSNDISPLQVLKELIDEEINKRELVERASFEYISNTIRGAINRCKGDLSIQ